MNIGSHLPQDGPTPRDAAAAETNSQPRAKEVPQDKLTLSESVKVWLGGASAGPEMIPAAESNVAYSEAAIRSKGKAEAELSPEKLAAIQDRVQSGFYNQDAVKRIIAGRLAEEIMEPSDSAD